MLLGMVAVGGGTARVFDRFPRVLEDACFVEDACFLLRKSIEVGDVFEPTTFDVCVAAVVEDDYGASEKNFLLLSKIFCLLSSAKNNPFGEHGSFN